MTNLHELRERARQAAIDEWNRCNGVAGEGQDILHVIADAVLLVVTQYVEQHEKQKNDSCAGLIHQTIPDVEGTEPRPRQYQCPTCGADQEAWR